MRRSKELPTGFDYATVGSTSTRLKTERIWKSSRRYDDVARGLVLPSPDPESEYEFKGHKLVFEATGANKDFMLG